MLDLETVELDRAARRAFWRSRGIYADYTHVDAIRDGVAVNGDTRLIFHSQVRPREATVTALNEEAERLAGAFSGLGLRKGDCIAVMLPTWSETALAYLAAFKLGLVLTPIVAIYGAREIGFIMRQTRAKALVIPAQWRGFDYLARVADAGELPDMQRLIVVGETDRADTVSWDELMRSPPAAYPVPEPNGDDLCLIIYTSGTTADPKGVKHTHNTLLCDLNAARAEGAAPVALPPPRMLSVFPAGHIAGYLSLMLPFLGRTADTVYVDQWLPEEGARLIEKHRLEATVGTPIFLTTLIRAAEQIGADISSLKQFGLGASAITPDNVRATDERGFPSGRVYGMSEHTVVSTSAGESFEKRAYTDGKITPRNQVRIVDDDGQDVPLGEEGEVATLGPRLFMGYVDTELDKACFLPGGWYKSGDIGRMDAEGFLTITDRKKDIIIRGGENISAKEIEDLLGGMPGVVESAVTAMPDREMGERVCAFIVPESGADLTLASVVQYFRDKGVTRQKFPERLVLVDDFPRTPSGKIRKVDLRERLRAEAAEASAG